MLGSEAALKDRKVRFPLKSAWLEAAARGAFFQPDLPNIPVHPGFGPCDPSVIALGVTDPIGMRLREPF